MLGWINRIMSWLLLRMRLAGWHHLLLMGMTRDGISGIRESSKSCGDGQQEPDEMSVSSRQRMEFVVSLFSYWRWRCKLADCFECSTPVAAAVGCSRADSRAMSSGR